MTGSDDSTPQGANTAGVDEPTEVLPAGRGDTPEPTLPLPGSPWSRPDPTWSPPDPTWAPPQQDWAAAQQSWAATQQQGWPSPQQGWASPQQQGWASPQQQQGWASPAAGQPGYTGYGSGAQPGSSASGPPQYPAAYQPGGYPPVAPVRPARRGQGMALVLALLVAFVLAGAGTGWATRSMFGAEQPSSSPTEPQVVPSTPEVAQPSTGNGGRTTSNEVSAAESVGVVLIEARSAAGLGAGTGMVLTADGKVLTNYHVVAGSEKLSVTIADSGDTYAATVIGFDQTRDVALIQLTDAGGLATVRTDVQVPDVGTRIAAVGNAEGGGELVKATGTVTATDQDLTVSSESPWGNTEDLSGLIQTNANAVPGDSGGPMFDSDNEVIGMTTAGSTSERTSYAVPIATALQVVQQVETGQDAGTTRVGPAGYLGVKVDDEQSGSGKTITEVVAGSPAARAGMTAGSRLTQVGDTTIRATTNLATVIRALEPGQQVRVAWTSANGTQRTATVTLGSSPVA